MDVLVITKDKNLRLNFKKEKIEITSFPIDKFKKAIEKYPAIYYQIIDNVYLKSYSVLYSSILRLRGLFIIECMLSTAKFSNKKFKNRIISLGRKEFENCHKAYRLIRDNMPIKSLRIRVNVAEKTLAILEKETGLVEGQINGQ